ncbi:MAG: hypothetical protein KIT84_19625 [Labilithrix sp.]|nr:hypothetical protein [Labilithrix sp.]MCW5813247.1 hypothetical protein [Labilithrix sp.]
MPTLLVNRKMHPALAARVEAAVTGGRPVRGRPRPAFTALVRIAFFVTIAIFVWAVATTKKPPARGAPKPAPALTAR